MKPLLSASITNCAKRFWRPKPIQRPYPKIIIGGGGRPVLRIAGKHADVANITLQLRRSGGFRAADLTAFDEKRLKERAGFLRDEAVKQDAPATRWRLATSPRASP